MLLQVGVFLFGVGFFLEVLWNLYLAYKGLGSSETGSVKTCHPEDRENY